MDARKKRLAWIAVGLIALVIGLGLAALQMDLGGQMKRCLEFVRSAGAPMFFTAMAVLPLLGFPLSPFVLSSGAVFAPTMGAGAVIACGAAAITANVTLSYWFAAVGLRPWMEKLVAWLGYAVPRLPPERSWELTLVLRVVPGIPFFLQSYLLGLARVRFGSYLLISSVVPSAQLAVAVQAGDALMEGNTGRLLLAGAGFAVLGLGLYFLRRWLARSKAAAQAEATRGGGAR